MAKRLCQITSYVRKVTESCHKDVFTCQRGRLVTDKISRQLLQQDRPAESQHMPNIGCEAGDNCHPYSIGVCNLTCGWCWPHCPLSAASVAALTSPAPAQHPSQQAPAGLSRKASMFCECRVTLVCCVIHSTITATINGFAAYTQW